MEHNENTIIRALKSLFLEVDKSYLSDGEKNVLKKLIEKLMIYYTKEYDDIMIHGINNNYNKMLRLSGEMTDYIVVINDTIKGKNDVHCIVNMIYKEINYDDKKGLFKRKRLI